MKKILLIAAAAAVIASPAFAASSKHLRSNAAANAEYAEGAHGAYAQDYYAVDGETVVSDGKVLGRDPDVFIRESLVRFGDMAELAGN
jgi:opacity protein-like surface antigen